MKASFFYLINRGLSLFFVFCLFWCIPLFGLFFNRGLSLRSFAATEFFNALLKLAKCYEETARSVPVCSLFVRRSSMQRGLSLRSFAATEFFNALLKLAKCGKETARSVPICYKKIDFNIYLCYYV